LRLQFTRAGDFALGRLELVVFGPGFRPNATFGFDDFSATAVPEPGMALLGFGAAAFLLVRRVRQRG
jgi:hypothetical protein